MRTFYIFKINKYYYDISKDIPFNLYKMYLNIRLGVERDLKLLYNEFYSVTDVLDKYKVSRYIYSKYSLNEFYMANNNIHSINNYYSDEDSFLKINNSFMILKTNKNKSSFFKVLSNIPYLFVIDFENNDYFFLNSI